MRLSPQPFHDHATARQIIGVYGREKFDSYFSFAVVRNPWDWQVSQFQYALSNPRHQFHRRAVELGNFKNYVDWRSDGGGRLITQADFLTGDNRQLAVTHVCRYETLADDFADVCKQLSISARLPSFNATKGRKPYWEYYDDSMVEIIGRLYQEDVEMFGYEFR